MTRQTGRLSESAWSSRRGFFRRVGWIAALALAQLAGCASTAPSADPLPSWNEMASKKAIVAFVQRTTSAGSPDFVPVPERVAVFDNDGTLWAEQPMYVQVYFMIDQVKALAPQHPEWKTKEPFARRYESTSSIGW